jgi:TrmH family RNA methyltransferase
LLSSDELARVRVVLVASRNPLNIGAAARAMSNFGFRQLRVVNPYEVAFREARSAVGASTILQNAEEYGSVAEAVADCALVVGTTAGRDRDPQQPLRRLETGARIIRKRLLSESVALLFGSEKRGLSNHDFSHCHWLVHIPARDEHPSMNLGQAVAICLYELVRDARATAPTATGELKASAGELERITAALLDALQTSGYVKPRSSEITDMKVRSLVRRLNLDVSDAELWLGMIKQIVWKLKQGG